jgi:phage shock protein A
MQIFDRLSLLLRANVNAAIDAAEDPEKVLDQLIRDADSVRRAAEQQLLVAITERNRMGAEVAYEEAQARKANARAEAAVRRGDDEQARAALRRRHDAVDAAQLFTQQLDAQQQMVERLKAQLGQVDSKLRHMRQERDSLVARKRLADAQLAMATSMQQLNGNGIESELTRLGRSVRVTEAHASAAAELSAYTLDGRLDPGDDEQVEAQLRALKQQVGQMPMLPRDPVLEQGGDDGDEEHLY